MLWFHINAAEEPVEDEQIDAVAEEPEKKGRGVASEANPFSKKQDSKKIPKMVDSFSSSNIDALAYDPEKKQLWVRFKGQDVYTYYDVPLKIYRGFWSAPSKGHYFWEKIRKNKHIAYQKLTSALRWIKIEDILNLNSAIHQANAASVAKSVLNWMKKNHPEYQPNPVLRDVFNGKLIVCPLFTVEFVGYGNKIRCNIQDKYSGKVQFAASDEQDVMKLTAWAEKLIERAYPNLESQKPRLRANREVLKTQLLQAATTASTTVNNAYDACLQLLPYLQDAIPEEHWQDRITDLSDDTSRIVADNYTIDITYPEDAKRVKVRVYDYWTQSEHTFDVSLKDAIMTILTGVLIIALQGTDPFPDNFE